MQGANAAQERGRIYAGEHRWDDAHAAFTEAMELRTEQPSIWIERGELLAMLGWFDLAEADFARTFEVHEPETTLNCNRFALLRLSLGDRDGYRQIRSRMRDRFQRTPRPVFAAELARATVLTDDTDAHDTAWVQTAQGLLASNSGDPNSWYLLNIAGLV